MCEAQHRTASRTRESVKGGGLHLDRERTLGTCRSNVALVSR
jgi:hypothetical protein